jgi:hypothetical protein
MSSKRFYGFKKKIKYTTKCEKPWLFSNDGDDYFVLEKAKEVQVFLPD